MQDFSLRCRMKEKGIDVMPEQNIPEIKGSLRDFMLKVPEPIYRCSGIKILGRRIKSVLFSTDASIIRNTNADAATNWQKILSF